ncbi:hypothetical protein PG999_012981 [Apiospora kogelbergensis]|uniref:Uncharacterized protein n=1 Tax=Apiospora kogelbergensis TaxID=1337665 RepID=A0AAW0QAI6_9PEZI
MHASKLLVGALLSNAAVLAAPTTQGKGQSTEISYEVDLDLMNAIYQLAYGSEEPKPAGPVTSKKNSLEGYSEPSSEGYSKLPKRNTEDLQKRRNPLVTVGKVAVGVAAAPVVLTVGAVAALLRLVSRV